MSGQEPKIKNLFKTFFISLVVMAAIEWFKYGTKLNYEWFHCWPEQESVGSPDSSVLKLWARGGPSCDKRGEYKTILKRISRDFEPNDEHLSFCIIENKRLPHVHYPIHEDKGEPGYWAYVGYNHDSELVTEMCGEHAIYNF